MGFTRPTISYFNPQIEIIDYGSEVCIIDVQRNNFLQLNKVIKQWNIHLNHYYKDTLKQ